MELREQIIQEAIRLSPEAAKVKGLRSMGFRDPFNLSALDSLLRVSEGRPEPQRSEQVALAYAFLVATAQLRMATIPVPKRRKHGKEV